MNMPKYLVVVEPYEGGREYLWYDDEIESLEEMERQLQTKGAYSVQIVSIKVEYSKEFGSVKKYGD